MIAGYREHYRKNGWIKNLYNKKRFHAHIIDDEIQIHMDRTINDHHVVANRSWARMLYQEEARLNKIYRSLDPAWSAITAEKIIKDQKERARKRKKGVEFAPNVLELQRQIGKFNQNPKKIPFRVRVKLFRRKVLDFLKA